MLSLLFWRRKAPGPVIVNPLPATWTIRSAPGVAWSAQSAPALTCAIRAVPLLTIDAPIAQAVR